MSELGFIIAGAGPCGIGAAWTLRHEFPHQRFLLVDPSPFAGGCAASEITPEGFTFDYGGHVLFPHKKYAEFGVLLKQWIGDWSASCPVRGVYMHGRLIAAPIQRNVHRLPRSEFAPIVADLLRVRLMGNFKRASIARHGAPEQTLEEYLNESFGRELTNRVMQPLNQKMWTLDPAEMSSVWVHQRSGSPTSNVAGINVGRLLKHALLGIDDPGWDASTSVHYPATGGVGSIWKTALGGIGVDQLRLGKRIVAVKTREKRVVFDDGSAERYSHLISSMPLDTLLELCVDAAEFRQLARGLRWASVLLFGYGIAGKIPERYEGVHSFQCPQRDLPFWRVTIPSNFSPGNVPDAGEYYSVLCEISCDPSEPLTIDAQRRQAVRAGLKKIGLLADASRITSRFEKVFRHGYPLPFLGRDRILSEIHRRLEPLSIFSRGRFGGWRYEVSNQDHAFVQGAEAVRHVLLGEPELTYTRPESAN